MSVRKDKVSDDSLLKLLVCGATMESATRPTSATILPCAKSTGLYFLRPCTLPKASRARHQEGKGNVIEIQCLKILKLLYFLEFAIDSNSAGVR
jgi:hypothetical protein